jgi:hypothetical protein
MVAAMTHATCPICDGGLSIGEPACPRCGFPASLREDALRVVHEPEGPRTPVPAAPRPEGRASTPSPSVRSGPDPVEALAIEFAQGITALRPEAKEREEYFGELQRAALAQAAGRPAEALALLRAVGEKLSHEAKRVAQVRLAELDARRASLEAAGVLHGLGPNLGRVRREMAEGRFTSACELLEAADARARQMEEESLQLRSTLTATEELWAAATTAGLPPVGLKERVEHIRRYLAEPTHLPEAVTIANRSAHELLTLLRTELAAAFTAELARNAAILSRYPVDDPGAQLARHQNAEAAARTHDGGYTEAAALLVQLRRTTEALPPPGEALEAARRVAPPTAPAAPAGPAAPATEVTKATLIEEARVLAARLRALPPNSQLATEAAHEIRRATDLVTKERRLEEAHEVLSRLMQTLDAAESGGVAPGPS